MGNSADDNIIRPAFVQGQSKPKAAKRRRNDARGIRELERQIRDLVQMKNLTLLAFEDPEDGGELGLFAMEKLSQMIDALCSRHYDLRRE